LTLRQIGGHLAGIRHYLGLEFFSDLHYDDVFAPLEVFIHDTLHFAAGTKYEYSTYDWSLISAVMEKATGTHFLDIINQQVVKALILSDLKADQKDSVQYQRVGFYDYRDSLFVISPVVDVSNKWAGGGFLCTADDLARLSLALADTFFLHAVTRDQFTNSQKTNDGSLTYYGIGKGCGKDQKGRPWFGHSGGSIGGTSMLRIFPEQDLAVVTLINLTGADMDGVASKIAEIILDDADH